MRSNRPVSIALACVLAATPLAACGTPMAVVDSEQEQEEAVLVEPSLISGTWTIDMSQNEGDALSKQDRDRFQKAAKSYKDLILTPRLLLASATDDGTDYVYLCTSKSDETDTDSWAIATVHESGSEAEIVKARKIDLTNIALVKSPQEDLTLGKWELAELGSTSILSDSKATIPQPADSKGDVSYTPLALIGTSDKPTSKRLYLAWETSNGEGAPSKAIALATVEPDDAGKPNTIAAEVLDLLAYL